MIFSLAGFSVNRAHKELGSSGYSMWISLEVYLGRMRCENESLMEGMVDERETKPWRLEGGF